MRKGFRHLSYADRIRIESLCAMKQNARDIAAFVGCSVSTVYRELQRGRYKRYGRDFVECIAYSADIAQKDYEYKASNKGADLKIGNDINLAAYIEHKIIKEKYSPAAVIGEIQEKGMVFETSICTKTLYNYIDKDVFLNLTNKDLLRKANRKQPYSKVFVRIKKPLCRSIEARPDVVNFRDVFGHWEMDTVIGKAKGKGQVLLVLTERQTRHELIFKMKSKTTHETIKILNRLERQYGSRFGKLFKTITVDNGSEFMDDVGMEKSCLHKGKRTMIYYCHPYSSWERGSNENANAMIRRFIPKSTEMEVYNTNQIQYIQNWINNYPRKILGWKCSNELFLRELQELA